LDIPGLIEDKEFKPIGQYMSNSEEQLKKAWGV